MIMYPGNVQFLTPNRGIDIKVSRGPTRLFNSLVAFWKLDEASGNRADSIGANTLTDNNTVASTTGLVYANAGSFVKASSEYLSINDNAALSTGDIDFWMAFWFHPTAIVLGGDDILGKWGAGSTQLEHAVEIYASGGNRFRWFVSSNGTGITGDLDTVEAGLTTGAWHLGIVTHDSVGNQLTAQLDNGTVRTLSYSGGVRDGTEQFTIGRGVSTRYFGGRIGPVMMGKGYLPTTADRTFLYNSGAGRTLDVMRDY